MTEERTIMWSGISGKEYKYWICPIGTEFDQVPGNYIFAKETKPYTWTPIYVGETDNLAERLTPQHEKTACVERYGGTHVHAHKSSSSKEVRCGEESDIVDKWNPPCNV